MREFALIGKNISYSLSPKIHSLIFDYYKISDCAYGILDIDENQLANEFIHLAKKYSGFNITIPHKNIVSELVTKNLSPIGAINTIVSKNGETVGYNTDIDGFCHSLFKTINEVFNDTSNANSCRNKPISSLKVTEIKEKDECCDNFDISFKNMDSMVALVIGAGGAAEAAIYALKESRCNLVIKSRQGERLNRILKRYDLEDNYTAFAPQIIINASGKAASEGEILSDVSLDKLRLFYDMSYNHLGQDEYFSNKGIIYKNGLEMLIYQAIYAAEILYGIKIGKDITELFNYINSKLSGLNAQQAKRGEYEN